jgi:hypothetical protein
VSLLLLLSAAALAQSAAPQRYQSVTETEYSINLTLEPNGRAQYEFVTWEADGSTPEEHEKLSGTWSRNGSVLTVHLSSHRIVTYGVKACLSYEEFGQNGCSPGLSLIKTDLPDSYGLKRFGLWDSASLHLGTQP